MRMKKFLYAALAALVSTAIFTGYSKMDNTEAGTYACVSGGHQIARN